MIVQMWHNWLQQPKMDKAWHKADIADELAELQEASGYVHTWSELSDVVYTVSRAKWSGHDFEYPLTKGQIIAGFLYMYPKYSSRALFFRRAGKLCGAGEAVQSVRNPRKAHKLNTIAGQYKIEPGQFRAACERQLKYWPLLP